MPPPTPFDEYKTQTKNTLTERLMPPTPIKHWTTLRQHLATNPTAEHILDAYGKSAWHTLEHDLTRHPYLQTRTTFDQAYIHALWHRTLHAARQDGQLTDKTYKELETITGIPTGRLRDWTLSEKTPHLERTLTIHETARQHWESNLPHETKEHLLNPSLIFETFKHLLDHPKQHTPEALATALQTLYQHGNDTRLTIIELKPYHKTGPQQLRTIAHTITNHRTQIAALVNHHLKLAETQEKLRLAIDHDVLYLWRKTTEPDHWLNTYKHELLYLKPTIKETLIDTTQRHLNVNTQQLGQLIDQLTEHTRKRTYNPRAIPYELWSTKYSQYLYGDTLHLLLDATNQIFASIKSHITQIGRIANIEKGGGNQNPQFPEGEKLDELRARLLAIALSDCHINKDTHHLTYHKSDLNRMAYGQTLFRQLGDCTYQLEQLKGGRYRLAVTAPVGRLLEHWGVPAGDKLLHPNLCLPETICKGSNEVKRAYIAEVIPEDGFFVNRAGAQKFGIKRAQILDAGQKTDIYEFQPKITHQHKELITKYGTAKTKTIRDDKPRDEITFAKGRLEDIIKTAETVEERQLAQQLRAIIRANPCQLLEDEKELIESLGIKMQILFKELKLQESERVSAIWEIYTKKAPDTYRWTQLALPSSGEKQNAVKEWVTKYQKEESHKSTKPKSPSKRSWERVV